MFDNSLPEVASTLDTSASVLASEADITSGGGSAPIEFASIGAVGNQLWSQNSSGIEGSSNPYDSFAWSLVTGDFNNDGFEDLAIGVPYEDVDGISNAGAVNVIYGTATGLNSTNDRIWSQDSPDIDGIADAGDRFGYSLATGDFNNDGFDDLAVGVPGENNSTGAVNVIYGSAAGLTATDDEIWTQASPGMGGLAEAGDSFGYSLATGDFDNDGFDDLAVGVPYEDVEATSATDAGAVNVLRGAAGGTTATGDEVWHQDSGGVQGVANSFDNFGRSLATGDFNNDGYDDLAIGVPNEDVGANANAGAVNVLRGSGTLLTDVNDELWHQDAGEIEGVANSSDNFGDSLATGDFNNDGFDDLAIGVPNEDVGPDVNAGAVNVLRGSIGLLTDTNDQFWSQDSAGIEGVADANDRFGSTLTVGDFDDDGFDDLAVGVPYENIEATSATNAGAVNVLRGASGLLTSNEDQIWSQDTAGIQGVAEPFDNFGFSLAAGDFDNDGSDDLAAGVPNEDVDGNANAGAVNVLYS